MINRNLVFILLVFSGCAPYRFIQFEHIGITTKPVPCLVIFNIKAKDSTYCEYQQTYTTSKSEFNCIKKFVLQNDTKSASPKSRGFGIFAINIDRKSYVVERENSVEYFTTLVNVLKINHHASLANFIESELLKKINNITRKPIY